MRGKNGSDGGPYQTDGGQEPEELTELDGIGSARADTLSDAGFETVADLRTADQSELSEVLGATLAERVRSQLGEARSDATEVTEENGKPTVPSSTYDGEGDDPTNPEKTNDERRDDGPTVPSTDDTGGINTVDGDPGGGETTDGSSQIDDEPTEREGVPVGSQTPPTAETEPSGSTTGETTASKVGQKSDQDPMVAAIVSFIVPGVGNVISGNTDRGLVFLGIWITWLVLGWGIGLFIFGTVIAFFTFGLGFVLIGLLVSLVELVIHLVAAYDAYRGIQAIDGVAMKIHEIRGN